MRKWLKVLILPAVLIFCLAAGAEAVTFGSSGGSSPAVKKSGKPSAPSGGNKGVIALLDLPQGQKIRLAESVELTRLSAIQADLAMKKLEDLNNRDASLEEMKAHLDYAQKSVEALGRAGNRLEDSVKIIRVALSGAEGKEALLAAAKELMEVFPSLREMLAASPAFAYGGPTPEQVIEYELAKISSAAKLEFEKATNALSNGANAVKNAASATGSALKNAAGWLVNKITSPIKAAHHKIGDALGQKNWAGVMAGTKFFTAITIAGVGLVVVVSAPVVSTGAAIGAVVVYTAANVGACVSLVNDINEIEGGQNTASGANDVLSGINKGTALIGLVGGGGAGEVAVNVIELTGDEIANAPGSVKMTPEELAGYLNEKDREEFLHNLGNLTQYQPPSSTQSGGGNEGSGGSGGCSGGCGN